jgi:hypothetical protein
VRRHKRIIVRAFLQFYFAKRESIGGHTPKTRVGLEQGIQVYETLKSLLDRAAVVFGASNYVIRCDSCLTLQYGCIKKGIPPFHLPLARGCIDWTGNLFKPMH